MNRLKLLDDTFYCFIAKVKCLEELYKRDISLYNQLSILDENKDFPSYEIYKEAANETFEEIKQLKRLFIESLSFFTKEEISQINSKYFTTEQSVEKSLFLTEKSVLKG